MIVNLLLYVLHIDVDRIGAALKKKDKTSEEDDVKDPKITFRKPENLESKEVENVARTKNSKAYSKKNNDKKKTESTGKKVKNKCLLSFDDEEHDDDG